MERSSRTIWMPEPALEPGTVLDYVLWGAAVILLCYYGVFMPLHLVALTFSRLWLYSRSNHSADKVKGTSTVNRAPDNVETLGQLSGHTFNGSVPTKNGYVHGGKDVYPTDHIPRLNGFTPCNGIQPLMTLQPHIQEEYEHGVTIIKPLIGNDPNLKVNLESFFKLNYTNYEIIFCIGELRNGPSLPIVKELMAHYPSVNVRIFQGGDQIGVNPKINNMLPGYRSAQFNLIWICDSGIIATPNVLKELTDHMNSDPQIALVHQIPYVAPVNDLTGYLDKVYFGTHHSRMYILATLASKNCANGMSWLVRKDALEQEGGIESFSEYLAEDFFMSQALLDRGWKCVLSTLPALQNPGNRSFTAFQSRVKRWCRLRCTIHPFISRLEPFTECLGLGIVGALSVHYLFGVNMLLFLSLHILFWFSCDLALIKSIENGPIGSLWKIALVWCVREIWTFPIFFGGACFSSKEVNWRGQQYRLMNGGKAVKSN